MNSTTLLTSPRLRKSRKLRRTGLLFLTVMACTAGQPQLQGMNHYDGYKEFGDTVLFDECLTPQEKNRIKELELSQRKQAHFQSLHKRVNGKYGYQSYYVPTTSDAERMWTYNAWQGHIDMIFHNRIQKQARKAVERIVNIADNQYL